MTATVNIITIGSSASGDYIRFALSGTDDNWKVGIQTRSDAGPVRGATTANWAQSVGTKMSVIGKWDTTTAHDTYYTFISVDGTGVGNDVQPTAVVGTYTTLDIVNENSSVCYVDNLKMYNTWQ
jgi:phosphoribosylformimino-5-aminoimidazole carboxamide ribonucleotide (ProFAR) isomerase